ncbi:hypothetical protein VNO80_10086 [Phaseolus coccineus]|uniref:Uncharacterized protein n=1 Tax=Phaseolus coccineus TaxID=3886 RepID=A0AAN9NCU0_PHACN
MSEGTTHFSTFSFSFLSLFGIFLLRGTLTLLCTYPLFNWVVFIIGVAGLTNQSFGVGGARGVRGSVLRFLIRVLYLVPLLLFLASLKLMQILGLVGDC